MTETAVEASDTLAAFREETSKFRTNLIMKEKDAVKFKKLEYRRFRDMCRHRNVIDRGFLIAMLAKVLEGGIDDLDLLLRIQSYGGRDSEEKPVHLTVYCKRMDGNSG